MRADLFVDTALVKLTDAERKRNFLNIQGVNPEIGKVKTMALTYLRIANYILYYNSLIIKTDIFDDKVFVSRDNGNFSTNKAFAIIPPTAPLQSFNLDFFSAIVNGVNSFELLENAQFQFPDRMKEELTNPSMGMYTSLYELLLHSLTIMTPTFQAIPLSIEVINNNIIINGKESNATKNIQPNTVYDITFAGTVQLETSDNKITQSLNDCLSVNLTQDESISYIDFTFSMVAIHHWLDTQLGITYDLTNVYRNDQLDESGVGIHDWDPYEYVIDTYFKPKFEKFVDVFQNYMDVTISIQ